jgi:hypothetical protein
MRVPPDGAACANPTVQFAVAEPITLVGVQVREEITEAGELVELVF